jgi:AraC-like DNA-binding protein
MKPDYEKIGLPLGGSFLYRIVTRESRMDLKGSWHYHPEYEICLNTRSKGKRFVGVDIENYVEGDLVLLGPDLPHCWITDEETSQIVVQFKEDFLGHSFFRKSEMSRIWSMLKRSKTGIFFPESVPEIRQTIEKMGEMSSPAALIALLDILHRMSLVEQTSSLTTSTYNKKLDMIASQRIEQVYSYVIKNLKRNPNLDTAAAKINMTKTSFCKFVKLKTKKTFSELVNDMRIAHAAKLLQITDMTAQEVCYDSGFNDPSYFYRVFSKRTGVSPKEYRKQFGTNRQRKSVTAESKKDAKSNFGHTASSITPSAFPS